MLNIWTQHRSYGKVPMGFWFAPSKLTSKSFYSKYLENGDKYEVGPSPRELLCVGPMGFRLAPSDLTLEDLVGSKIKVILFDGKYVKNCKSYDVGPWRLYRVPMGFTLDGLERLKVKVTILWFQISWKRWAKCWTCGAIDRSLINVTPSILMFCIVLQFY